MRCSTTFLTLTLLTAAIANAQVDTAPDRGAEDLQVYTLMLVEFRLNAKADPKLSPAKIAEDFDQLLAAGSVSLIEALSLSILQQQQASVMFGRTVAVTTGVTQAQFGKTRNTQQRPLGTSVKVIAEPLQDKVLLKLNYQASRIVGEVDEDTTPDIETIEIDTSLLLKLGARHMVAGSSAASSNCLMVWVIQ